MRSLCSGYWTLLVVIDWMSLLKNPKTWLLFGSLALAQWPFWIHYNQLQKDYGTEAGERSKVTNPVDISVLLQKAINNCDSKKNKSPKECEAAIDSLSRSLTIVDIEAQRSMAKSALGILHLNFWQIILSVLLFGAVGWTLFETRKTANAAVRTANAAENAERPFLYTLIEPVKRDTHSIMKVSIQNLGNSPAGDIKVFFQYGRVFGFIGQGNHTLEEIQSYEQSEINAIPAGELRFISEVAIGKYGFMISLKGQEDGFHHPGSTGMIFATTLSYQDLVTENTKSITLFDVFYISGSGKSIRTSRANVDKNILLKDFGTDSRNAFLADKNNKESKSIEKI